MRHASLIATVLWAAAGTAHAQTRTYPAKPIRILVGNAPGGGVDIVGRAVAQKLTARWGRPVVVDNRAGASGIVAMDLTAQANADGYTLLAIPGSMIASAGVQKKVAYDVRTAYAPVTQLATLVYLMSVTASVPASTVQQFVAYAKARPDTLSYASSGVGGLGHLASALFCEATGIRMIHVPYKGSGPALADLIAGQVQMGITASLSGMPHVRSGKLKALGMTGPKRAQAFPEVPTIAEAGVPGFELVNWYGLFAPAATPREVLVLLQREIARNLGAPDIQQALAKDGAEAAPSASPEALGALLAKEVQAWQQHVKLRGFAEQLQQ